MLSIHGWEIALGYFDGQTGTRITVTPEPDAPQWLTGALLKGANHWCQRVMGERQDCTCRAYSHVGDKDVIIEALGSDKHAILRAVSYLEKELVSGVWPEMARAAS